MRAGQDKPKLCVCWNKFKPTWDKIMADPAAKDVAADMQKFSDMMKQCDGFATSPSFLLVAAAALSMTLFTMRNPLE